MSNLQRILDPLIDIGIIGIIVFAFFKGGIDRIAIGKVAYGILDILVGTGFGIWAFLRMRL